MESIRRVVADFHLMSFAPASFFDSPNPFGSQFDRWEVAQPKQRHTSETLDGGMAMSQRDIWMRPDQYIQLDSMRTMVMDSECPACGLSRQCVSNYHSCGTKKSCLIFTWKSDCCYDFPRESDPQTPRLKPACSMFTRTRKNYEKKAMARELDMCSDIFMSLRIASQWLL